MRCLAILVIIILVCYGAVKYTPKNAVEPPPHRTGRYLDDGTWIPGHFEATTMQPNGSIGYRWVPESDGPKSGSVSKR